MGTMAGWETRRRNEARRQLDLAAALARQQMEQERARLRPLLERCLEELESARVAGDARRELAADLRRELGKEE